jgi:hypothetical protein
MVAAMRGNAIDDFKETERRLQEWGDETERYARAIGLPSMSSIARMIAHVRREERLHPVTARKRQLRAKRRASLRGGPRLLPEEAAELKGFRDQELTARGKQKLSMHEQPTSFSSAVMQVEVIVRALPGWMKAVIYRTYKYRQPHRIAAKELRLDVADYRSRWRAGVWQVAEKLAERRSGAVHSTRPRSLGDP